MRAATPHSSWRPRPAARPWVRRTSIDVCVVNPLNAHRPSTRRSVSGATCWTPSARTGHPARGGPPRQADLVLEPERDLAMAVALERRAAAALAATADPPGRAGASVERHVAAAIRAGSQRLPAGARLAVAIDGPDGAPSSRTTIATLADASGGTVTLARSRTRGSWDIDSTESLPRDGPRRGHADGATPMDKVTARFGMREIRTEGGRILLNGRPIYMLGALDQDLYPDDDLDPAVARLPRRADAPHPRDGHQPAALPHQGARSRLPRCGRRSRNARLVRSCPTGRGSRRPPRRAVGRRSRRWSSELGNHPSIVIWTIINEDWGTDVRHEARDRPGCARRMTG